MENENQNKNFETFFNPGSIAIVGATDGVGKVGTVVTRNILNLGYLGKVFLVNPTRKELYKKECYAKLEDIGESVDLAVVIVPANIVPEIVKNGANKTKNFVIISAGFRESGEEGKKREAELLKIAEDLNLAVLGPNCLGFINPKIKLNATFAGGMPKRGNMGFITQSGALAVALLDIFEKEEAGFSGIFSIGNKMQLDEADSIEFLGADAETKVIGIYLEGIKNGRKFMEVAARISRNKPIIILKAGKTEKAQQAIASHTGALVGSDCVVDAIFKKCGIIRAEDLEQFLELMRFFSAAKTLINNEVAIITNAGGGGVLATDAFKNKNIKLTEISKTAKEELRRVLPEASSVENPIDVLGDAHEDRFKTALSIIDKEKAGSIICLLTPQEQTPVEKIAEEIIEFSRKTNKAILVSFIGGDKVKNSAVKMKKAGIASFAYPEKAVEALDKFTFWESTRKKEIAKHWINQDRAKSARDIISKAVKEKRKALLFSEAEKIFKSYGINLAETYDLHRAVGLKYPVALKVDSDKVLHKTDKKGVVLGIKNREELQREAHILKNYFSGANLIVQPMSQGHQELVVGFKRDEIFGPVVAFGLGGIYTEIFKMVDLAVPPLGLKEIEQIVSKSKIGFLGKSVRGKRAYDLSEVTMIICKLGELALENPGIMELDINPLFIYNDGRKAAAADVKIII